MKDLSIKDLKKTEAVKSETAPVKVIKEEKLTPSDEFLLECDDQEAEIFERLKDILMTQCKKREFEAVTKTNLESFSMVITYVKHNVIKLEEDGFTFELREPLVNEKGDVLTDVVKVLYKKNHDRYRTFTKGKKLDSNEDKKSFNIAVLAASLDNINNSMISPNVISILERNNELDFTILISCLNFFRY